MSSNNLSMVTNTRLFLFKKTLVYLVLAQEVWRYTVKSERERKEGLSGIKERRVCSAEHVFCPEGYNVEK